MVDKLNNLVWSVKPSQDSLHQLLDRLHQYGKEMCMTKDIQFMMDIPLSVVPFNFPDEHRYNVYLTIKEAINNAVKYSSASILELKVKETSGILEVTVSDNGKGFNVEQIEKGNGLNNMEKRMKEIGAGYNLYSAPGKCCLISIHVKIIN